MSSSTRKVSFPMEWHVVFTDCPLLSELLLRSMDASTIQWTFVRTQWHWLATKGARYALRATHNPSVVVRSPAALPGQVAVVREHLKRQFAHQVIGDPTSSRHTLPLSCFSRETLTTAH